MKKIIKKIFIGCFMAIAASGASVAYADFVPINTSNPEPIKFLDTSATNQSKQGWLGLGFTPGSYNPLATLDVKNTSFTSALSVLGKGWVSGKLLVGYSSIPTQITNSLMVAQDYIRSSLLAGSGSRPVCSDATGNFVLCSNTGPQATPQIVSTSPLCGSAANTFANTTPTINLCNTGANAQVLGSVSYQQNGAYSWTCYTYNGSITTAQCATSPLPPTCGQAAYVATTSAPTANRCLSGTPSTVTGGTNGVYSWTCSDTYGNTPATCTTPANNTLPVQPKNCFAMHGSSYDRAVLTCAEGSPSATSYRVQAYHPSIGWSDVDGSGANQFHTISAANATPISAGIGSWTNRVVQELPSAIFLSSFSGGSVDYFANEASGYALVWKIAGCNSSGCGPYSAPIYPGPFYGVNGYYGPYTPDFTIEPVAGGKIKFSWTQPANEPYAQALYNTAYIRKCVNNGCVVYGGGIGAGFSTEPVSPADLTNGSSNTISHTPISCVSNICSVTTTLPQSMSDDYMITVGKNLYNDAFPGPTATATNPNLTGYLSTWEQFSPWYSFDN